MASCAVGGAAAITSVATGAALPTLAGGLNRSTVASSRCRQLRVAATTRTRQCRPTPVPGVPPLVPTAGAEWRGRYCVAAASSSNEARMSSTYTSMSGRILGDDQALTNRRPQ